MYMQLLLVQQAFAYRTLEAGDPKDAFHSPLISELLGKAHLCQLHGWVDIPSLNLQAKNRHGMKGALALCVTVVFIYFLWLQSRSPYLDFKLERAIRIIHNGQVPAGRENDDATTEGPGPSNLKSKSSVKTVTPRKLNKVTGKKSTACHAFSQQNLGSTTTNYFKSITNCTSDIICEIIDEACEFEVAQGTGPGLEAIHVEEAGEVELAP